MKNTTRKPRNNKYANCVDETDEIGRNSAFTQSVIFYLLENPKQRFKNEIDFFNKLPKNIYTAGGCHDPIVIKNKKVFFHGLLLRGIIRLLNTKNWEKQWFQSNISFINK